MVIAEKFLQYLLFCIAGYFSVFVWMLDSCLIEMDLSQTIQILVI